MLDRFNIPWEGRDPEDLFLIGDMLESTEAVPPRDKWIAAYEEAKSPDPYAHLSDVEYLDVLEGLY